MNHIRCYERTKILFRWMLSLISSTPHRNVHGFQERHSEALLILAIAFQPQCTAFGFKNARKCHFGGYSVQFHPNCTEKRTVSGLALGRAVHARNRDFGQTNHIRHDERTKVLFGCIPSLIPSVMHWNVHGFHERHSEALLMLRIGF